MKPSITILDGSSGCELKRIDAPEFVTQGHKNFIALEPIAALSAALKS